MKHLRVANAARSDLADIAQKTEQSWGLEQKRRYLQRIAERLAQIRERPSLGPARPEIGIGYRSISAGQHVIFYREADDVIEIVRVLHGRMDARRHVPDDG